ncbi:hypothetical protein B0T11DRAFT_276534 [Plectosphaerella cucumerina]|uniref:Uncharacterized protein n=1 Tax=Plectosphaerella cucumerina TaxID=40658 RepID=A0A8K0TRW1_9PEZI|nr:hypothetical protein B0T11DRAFT_276534 [Plectosphaerella cucumerina]
MENTTPRPHNPRALKQEPPNAFILICGPITTATWLIIGGIALSSDATSASSSADVVVILCCAVHLIATVWAMLGLGPWFWHRRLLRPCRLSLFELPMASCS